MRNNLTTISAFKTKRVKMNQNSSVSAIGENFKSMFSQPSWIKRCVKPFKPMLKSCRRHHLTRGCNRRIESI